MVQQPKLGLGRLDVEMYDSCKQVAWAGLLTQHTINTRKTPMPSAGFETAISAIKCLKTYARPLGSFLVRVAIVNTALW